MAEQCGLAPKSIYNETIVIKQFFKWATKNGYLSRNLLELIHFAKVKSPKQPCFTIDQVELLLRDDLILFNPFDRLRGNATEPDKDWKYVSLEELDKLLDACPNIGWKVLIALCRLAGLRRGEALELNWSAINWQEHHFTVITEKTGLRPSLSPGSSRAV